MYFSTILSTYSIFNTTNKYTYSYFAMTFLPTYSAIPNYKGHPAYWFPIITRTKCQQISFIFYRRQNQSFCIFHLL